ncbi:hypothetical protein [Moraxella boevrei]|uniref:hypothetical protein n=1 Tax=Faucicola boevrei TaxID=346665 RepID=UPI003736F892
MSIQMNEFWREHFFAIKQLIQDEKKHFIVGLFLILIVGYAIGGWLMAGLMLGLFLLGIFMMPFASWEDAFHDN